MNFAYEDTWTTIKAVKQTINLRINLTPDDIVSELSEYSWDRDKWTDTRLIAASPFRSENRPSFYVDLTHGGWRDSGAHDEEYASGNFVSLIAKLRGYSYEEAADYLYEKYVGPVDYYEDDLRKLPEGCKISETSYSILQDDILRDHDIRRHPYLSERGISAGVQRMMQTGYDSRNQAVTLPWFNADGTISNVMYRKVYGKAFWYHRGGRPIADMLYGIHIVYKRRIRRVVIAEAPIDALSVMTATLSAGRPVFAIATGGTAFGRAKAEMIIRSPIKEVIIMRDNDDAGRLWQRRIVRALAGLVSVKIATNPIGTKDCNDVLRECGGETLVRRIEKAREVSSMEVLRRLNV